MTMDRIDDLLEKTSRTFALSIPLLPEPTRRELSIAYLLFRIADTFEDAAAWLPERQIGALDDFIALLENPSNSRATALGESWGESVPIEHEGYVELLRETPLVIEEWRALSPGARAIVARHTIRTARGMAGWVARTEDGELRLSTVEELRAYCYTVAGIVGELSTELFLLGRPELQPIADSLGRRAARFGEALQLVNILKDADFDSDEGRRYLPSGVPREDVFALARSDLGVATEYTLTLQEGGAPRGVVAFCALPVRLAVAALDRVETDGPGSKVSRDQVWEIVGSLNEALDAGDPAIEAASVVQRN
jgi:farnesyl-diphosphate farnesyltransferase